MELLGTVLTIWINGRLDDCSDIDRARGTVRVESRCICPSEKGQTLDRLHYPAGVSARWTVDLHDSACLVSGFVSASPTLPRRANCASICLGHGPD